MRIFFLHILLFSSSFILHGQTVSSNSFDIFLQSRFLHQPNTFSAGQEFSLGGRYNFNILKPLSLSIAAQLNYAAYVDQHDDAQETFFVDYFKGASMDYFNYQKVRHFNLETPIGFHVDLGAIGKSNIAWIGTLSPSFNLWSWSEGNRFEEQLQVSTALIDVFQQENVFPADKHYLFDDLFISSGVHLNFPLAKSKTVFLESGYEYSIKGKSSGLFLRGGLKF